VSELVRESDKPSAVPLATERPRPPSRRRLRLWMSLNAAALTLLCYQVTTVATPRIDAAEQGAAQTAPVAQADPPRNLLPPTRDRLLGAGGGLYFGVATYRAPSSVQDLRTAQAQAGAQPTLTSYSTDWPGDFDPAAAAAAYRAGAVPLLTWQPTGITPARIASGRYDRYVSAFARAVAAARVPLVLRLTPQLAGTENAADYVRAWRRVHDLFRTAGAGNVIWVWSPDTARTAADQQFAPLYPGDAYVDWLGLDGYGVQPDPHATFDTALGRLRGTARKPVLITRTGAGTTARTTWIRGFFGWLTAQPDVIGFVWDQQPPATASAPDWRFSADLPSMLAFRSGLRTLLPRLDRSTALVTPRPPLPPKKRPPQRRRRGSGS
jgi:hypothetical protein